MTAQALIACPSCDLLHRRGELAYRGMARCVRCGKLLYRHRQGDLDRPLALALAALLFLVAANLFPFISFHVEGRIQESVLATGLFKLYGDGYMGMAVLILLTGIVCPLLHLAGLAYVLTCLRWGRGSARVAWVYRWVRHLQPWAMTEVYMLGILVTAAKLIDLGRVVPGVGLYAFAGLLFMLPVVGASLDPDSVWERIPFNSAA